MKVTTKNEKILGHKTEALILGLFEKQKITGDLKNIDNAINNEISFMIKNKEFKGEFKEAKLISTHRKLPANKILLTGLGKGKDFTSEKLRKFERLILGNYIFFYHKGFRDDKIFAKIIRIFSHIPSIKIEEKV